MSALNTKYNYVVSLLYTKCNLFMYILHVYNQFFFSQVLNMDIIGFNLPDVSSIGKLQYNYIQYMYM